MDRAGAHVTAAARRLLDQLAAGNTLMRVAAPDCAPLYYLEEDGMRSVIHHRTVASMLKAGTLVEGDTRLTPTGSLTALHAAES